MDVKTAAFEVGEEVVVRLAHAQLFDPRRGTVLSTLRRPPWMIARILHYDDAQGGRRYVLSFQHRDAAYLCSVDERDIEGTA